MASSPLWVPDGVASYEARLWNDVFAHAEKNQIQNRLAVFIRRRDF